MMPQFNLVLGGTTFELADCLDAEFIIELRTDAALNSYISETNPEIAAQIQWLSNYKRLEARREEYYFIIKYLSKPVGTVRLYDFREDSFGWGSWVIKRGTDPSVAIASALLVYQAGFDILKFKNAHFEVRKGNESVIRFHKRTGAVAIKEDDLNVYFSISHSDFSYHAERFRRFV